MSTPHTPVPETMPYRWRWAALAVVLVAEAMNLLDSTIVTVAAPVIHARLPGPDADIQWFSAAYTLPFAVLLIAGGRIGDLAGRGRVFRVGVAVFLLASVGCALAPSAGLLISARVIQGSAAAIVIPQTLGLIRGMFGGAEMARALGSIGPVMGLSAVCGPLLGGLLTHADLFGSSWRSVFLVNVPLGIAVLIGSRLIRDDRTAPRARLDLLGTAIAILGAGLVVYPLIDSANWSARSWTLLGAGTAFLVVFGFHQRHRARHRRSALVEASLFRNRGFPAALVTSTVFFAMMNGLMLVIVLQLQLGLHTDVRTAGLTLLPWSAGSAVTSAVAGSYLVPRYGARVMFAGLPIVLAGCIGAAAVYATGSLTGYPWALLPALAVCGLGLGLFTVPFFTTALHRVRPHETGSAAGLLNSVQQFGGTLGIALFGSVFFHAARGTGPAGPAALQGAQHACWIAMALIVVTGLTATLMIPRRSVTRPGLESSAPTAVVG